MDRITCIIKTGFKEELSAYIEVHTTDKIAYKISYPVKIEPLRLTQSSLNIS